MIIDDIEFFAVEIDRTDADRPVRSLIVRIDSDDGREGWGETPLVLLPSGRPPNRSALLALLAGRSVFCVEEILDADLLSCPPLRLTVEMAVWDLIGRTLKQPLCRIWGGAYRPAVPLAARLPPGSPRRLAEVARAWAEQGLWTQTIEASGSLDADLAMLADVRAAAGGRLRVRLDAGGQYHMEAARDLCSEIEFDAPELLIDPIAMGDFFAVASLARQTIVPLAVSRAIARPSDAFAAVRCGAGGTVVIDPTRVGSLRDTRQCSAVSAAGGASVVVSGPPSVGIAAAAMLQLIACTPALASPYECVYRQLRDDVLRHSIAFADGNALVPLGPGLGVEIDRGKLERYQITL